MSRDIKFRGKAKDLPDVPGFVHGSFLTNVWNKADTKEQIPYIFARDLCEGCKCDCDSNEELFSCDRLLVEVIPETVGEYTGLHDNNGKEIYEGDILRFPKWTFDQYEDHCVEYKNGVVRLVATENKTAKTGFSESVAKGVVIGNKFDNPEFLQVST